MRKKNLILASVLCVFLVGGCSKNNIEEDYRTYQDIPTNMVLDVGGKKFSNTYESIDTKVYMDYISAKIHTLHRSSYETSNSVYHNGYYYYWQSENVYDSLLLGTKTETITKDYSYIIYGEDTNISIKSKTTVITKYSYESTILEKEFTSTFDLNGYFESIDALKQDCPKLLENIEIKGKNVYPVSAKAKTEIFYEDNNYSQFYYFEKIDDKK